MSNPKINFKKLTIKQKDEIQKFTSQFEPYSDFNFVSLIAWDVNEQTEYAFVNNNLVIKMTDYISGEPVVSVLGNNSIDETLEILLMDNNEIHLVPETVIKNIKYPDKFYVIEDLDNHDYVYSLEKLANLEGGEFKTKRNQKSKFIKESKNKLRLKTDLHNDLMTHRSQITDVLTLWGVEKNKTHNELKTETQAINRLMDLTDKLDLVWAGLFSGNKLIGFSVNETLNNGYANCHFQKTVLSFKNADVYLTTETSSLIKSLGCKFINWEQDLGIKGLRQLKKSYKPTIHLKKYKISRL